MGFKYQMSTYSRVNIYMHDIGLHLKNGKKVKGFWAQTGQKFPPKRSVYVLCCVVGVISQHHRTE